MNMITVVLLNWKRPDNLNKLLEALASQTHKPTIFLWDNSNQPANRERFEPLVDWYVSSNLNMMCPPRWWMAQQAQTPFVMSFDDDLMPADKRLLEDMEKEIDDQGPHRIVGAFGKNLRTTVPYEHCPASIPGEYCDIILGRVMVMNTRVLRRRLEWPILFGNNWGAVDDIVLSAMFYNKYKQQHYCSEVMQNRLTELPDEYALCKQPGHFQRREAARRQWFDK